MGLRSRTRRFGGQFRTDLGTLFCRQIRGGPSLSARAHALDRLAGSAVLLGAMLAGLWLAGRVVPADLTGRVAESAQAASAPATAQPQPDGAAASEAMTAEEIRKLQNWLVMLGLDPGPVDGIAGARTLDAFNQYRASKRLDPVSSIERADAAELLN